MSRGPLGKAGWPGVFMDTQLCHGVNKVGNIPWSWAGQPGAHPHTGHLMEKEQPVERSCSMEPETLLERGHAPRSG